MALVGGSPSLHPYPSSHGVKALAEKERTGTSFQPLTTRQCTGHFTAIHLHANLTCVDTTYCCNEKNIRHEIRVVATFYLTVSSLLAVSRSSCPDPDVQCCSLSLVSLLSPVQSRVPVLCRIPVPLLSLCVLCVLCSLLSVVGLHSNISRNEGSSLGEGLLDASFLAALQLLPLSGLRHMAFLENLDKTSPRLVLVRDARPTLVRRVSSRSHPDVLLEDLFSGLVEPAPHDRNAASQQLCNAPLAQVEGNGQEKVVVRAVRPRLVLDGFQQLRHATAVDDLDEALQLGRRVLANDAVESQHLSG
jgi:hypothetical protein